MKTEKEIREKIRDLEHEMKNTLDCIIRLKFKSAIDYLKWVLNENENEKTLDTIKF